MNPLLRYGVPLLLTAAVGAQRLPLPDGSDRIVQLFDLQRLQSDKPATPANAVPMPGFRREAVDEKPTLGVADVIARFLEPPLGNDDALTQLGTRWLALLGSPRQAASAERLFDLATKRREQPIDVTIVLWTVPDELFRKHVQERLTAATRGNQVAYEAVLGKPAAGELERSLEKASAEQLHAPGISVFPLQPAMMSVVNQTSYVKDFAVTRVGDRMIADPIIDIVWDGVRSEVVATFLPEGAIGLACDFTVQELERPIAEFKTTIGIDTPVTVQLPSTSTTRLQQTAVLTDGAMVALASRRVDGSWILATVRAVSDR